MRLQSPFMILYVLFTSSTLVIEATLEWKEVCQRRTDSKNDSIRVKMRLSCQKEEEEEEKKKSLPPSKLLKSAHVPGMPMRVWGRLLSIWMNSQFRRHFRVSRDNINTDCATELLPDTAHNGEQKKPYDLPTSKKEKTDTLSLFFSARVFTHSHRRSNRASCSELIGGKDFFFRAALCVMEKELHLYIYRKKIVKFSGGAWKNLEKFWKMQQRFKVRFCRRFTGETVVLGVFFSFDFERE